MQVHKCIHAHVLSQDHRKQIRLMFATQIYVQHVKKHLCPHEVMQTLVSLYTCLVYHVVSAC